MKIDSVVVGSYRANCYVLREGTSMIVIDPGDEPAEVLGLIGSKDDVGSAGESSSTGTAPRYHLACRAAPREGRRARPLRFQL